jgi:hypothetical protein
MRTLHRKLQFARFVALVMLTSAMFASAALAPAWAGPGPDVTPIEDQFIVGGLQGE